jgi:hypothetical protein
MSSMPGTLRKILIGIRLRFSYTESTPWLIFGSWQRIAFKRVTQPAARPAAPFLPRLVPVMIRSQSNNTALHFLIVAGVAVAVFFLWCLHRVKRLGKPSV